jgi:hypothetical protein
MEKKYTVVGLYFRGKTAQDSYDDIKEGWEGFLEREPSNPHDKMAVKVIMYHPLQNKFRFIGYLPRGSSSNMQGDFVTIRFDENKEFTIGLSFPDALSVCAYVRTWSKLNYEIRSR